MQRKKFQKLKGAHLSLLSPAVVVDEEAALAARAAWLHFSGGKTQGEVAGLLGVQSTKAHRLIAKARNEGLVRVIVEGPIAGCIDLEEQLLRTYGLEHCTVVPNIDEGPLPRRTLGTAGARYLRNLIESGRHELIGVGHGRTLAAAVDAMPGVDAGETQFVSLLGGLTRRFAASPFDVIHRLAEKTSAEAFVLPVPFFANTARDRAILESQFGVSDVIAKAKKATVYLAGIGEVARSGFIGSAHMLDNDDIDELISAGAVAEILGQFFASGGRHLSNSISDRALAPRIEDLKTRQIVALAGGTSKTQAIRAVLASGLLSGLITDEATAKRLVRETPAKSGKKNGKTAQMPR